MLTGVSVRDESPDFDFLNQTSARIREIFHYWYDRRRPCGMPRRADFDPADLPWHLPGILLIDVEDVDAEGVGVYRYRVVGTGEVDSRGYDPTGKLIRDGFFGPSLAAALAAYETVRQSGSYLYEPLTFVTADFRRIEEYSILLPFSENGETVSQILVFSERRERR